MKDALIYLVDIYIRFCSKLYRQNVGIPMGTNCAPLVADLFLFCYERDFMESLTKEKRCDLIDAFNSTSRYLDDHIYIYILYLIYYFQASVSIRSRYSLYIDDCVSTT